MDRFHELENWRRSLVMLPPGSLALDREDAVALIAELQEAEGRLRGLRDALRLLLPMEGDRPGGGGPDAPRGAPEGAPRADVAGKRH